MVFYSIQLQHFTNCTWANIQRDLNDLHSQYLCQCEIRENSGRFCNFPCQRPALSHNASTRSEYTTVNLFITTFIILSKFVITSIWSAQKSADRVFFIDISHFILQKKHTFFLYLLESPRKTPIIFK